MPVNTVKRLQIKNLNRKLCSFFPLVQCLAKSRIKKRNVRKETEISVTCYLEISVIHSFEWLGGFVLSLSIKNVSFSPSFVFTGLSES